MTNTLAQTRRCPRCDAEVSTEERGPCIVGCPACGAEVSFAGVGDPGDHIGRVGPAGHPTGSESESGATTCQNCGAAVPLRGVTPAERLHRDPEDLADTVTCPACGVEVAAVRDQHDRDIPADVRTSGGEPGLESVEWRTGGGSDSGR